MSTFLMATHRPPPASQPARRETVARHVAPFFPRLKDVEARYPLAEAPRQQQPFVSEGWRPWLAATGTRSAYFDPRALSRFLGKSIIPRGRS
ncbi:hypothetical protein E2C01_094251 [Portunus trituberculatus]|uniref:Uncharacterized protein n=1 Tax=Portunus trituberculatus TaxID=210409 RepID=A0A5B7JX36_PORTR|nr:hypothetical protein [Portunus trituberculatus]